MKNKILSILKVHSAISLMFALLVFIFLPSPGTNVFQFKFIAFFLLFIAASVSIGPFMYFFFASQFYAPAAVILAICFLIFLSISFFIYWWRHSQEKITLYISSASWSAAGCITVYFGVVSGL